MKIARAALTLLFAAALIAQEQPASRDVSPNARIATEAAAAARGAASVDFVNFESLKAAESSLLGAEGFSSARDAARITFCELQVEYMHGRSLAGTVGFKPRTTCEVPVSLIRHKSKLSVQRGTEWRQVGLDYLDSNRAQLTLYTKDIEYRCRTAKEVTWRGTTLVTVIYDGKSYFGVATTPARVLRCGTRLSSSG